MNLQKIAIVLAGGQSCRFGSNKLFEPFRGKPMIQWVLQSLTQGHFSIMIGGPKKQWLSLGYPIIEDQKPYAGPLLALDSIFEQTKFSRVLLIAGDTPMIQPETLCRLWKASHKKNMALFKTSYGLSPLPGVYSRLTIPFIKKQIREGKSDLKSLILCGLKMGILFGSEKELTNINTRQDLSE